MLAKITLRVPEPLLDRLRELSRKEGRSLNDAAVRALERGLGGLVHDEGWLALGSLVEVPPSAQHEPDELRRMWSDLGAGARGLDEDLDWVRGDR